MTFCVSCYHHWLPLSTLETLQCIEDQRYLRELVAASDGIAFIADGAVLPRRSGSDDSPMGKLQGVVPFQSPPSLRREFELPHRGNVVGMLVPRGVTVIVGGGYHGEMFLLHTISAVHVVNWVWLSSSP